jgi:hypothetical protein
VRARNREARVSSTAPSITATTTASNPNQPGALCGGTDYFRRNSQALFQDGAYVGAVYLMAKFLPNEGTIKCVVTIKEVSIGTSSPATAYLEVQGRSRVTDPGRTRPTPVR